MLQKFVDLMVVASRMRFITEEVYLVVMGQKFQAVCLVPAYRKHVETNLAAD